MAIEPLTDEERADALDSLPDWDYDDGRDAISRSFTFPGMKIAEIFNLQDERLVRLMRQCGVTHAVASFGRAPAGAGSGFGSVADETTVCNGVEPRRKQPRRVSPLRAGIPHATAG